MRAVAAWLVTSMEVPYAQVLGSAVVLLTVLWIAGTLYLWWCEERLQLANVREELHLCRRTLQRTNQDLWRLQAKRALQRD